MPLQRSIFVGVDHASLIANVAATWMMVGVIWFVQLVHYPLLSLVKVSDAPHVALEHQRRTAFVVMVPMTVEGVSTLVLLGATPEAVWWWLPWAGGVLLAVALGCTVLLSVPLHKQMAESPKSTTGQRLVRTNWPRTIAWSLRGLLCVLMLAQLLA